MLYNTYILAPTNFLNKDNGPPIPVVPPAVPVGVLDNSHAINDTSNKILPPANAVNLTLDKTLECFKNMFDKCKVSLDVSYHVKQSAIRVYNCKHTVYNYGNLAIVISCISAISYFTSAVRLVVKGY